jgi:hypothetical protein
MKIREEGKADSPDILTQAGSGKPDEPNCKR